MLHCSNCDTQIPPEFSFALKRNECPACGESIMDEESLALVEDLQASIKATAPVRDQTAEQLAMMLVTTYSVAPLEDRPKRKQAKRPQHRPKIQEPEDEGPVEEEEAIRLSDVANAPISDEEKQAIYEERLKARYNLELSGDKVVSTRKKELSPEYQQLAAQASQALSDSEMLNNPLVEQERLKRMARQQQNLAHGPPSAKAGAMVQRSG